MNPTDVLKIALLQAELHWEDPKANLEHFERLLSQLDSDTQLAVLPEMFTTGVSMNPDGLASDASIYTWLQQQATTRGDGQFAT